MFFQGIRPKTLAAAFVPPLCASAYVYFELKTFDLYILAHCLGLALFIQMATNFYNDGVDFLKGADENRDGPLRIAKTSNIKQVFWFGHICLFIAFLFGVPLVMKGGAVFALLGVLSLFLAYGYTGGPFPLAYLGLGELFVFLFFGLLAFGGSAYLMSGSFEVSYLVIGSIFGLLSSVLIAINNLRDKDKDKLVGKRTLATRISQKSYLGVLDLFLFGPYLIVFYLFCFIELRFIFPILAVGLAHKIRFKLRDYKHPSELNECLSMSGKHLIFFSLLFILSCLTS